MTATAPGSAPPPSPCSARPPSPARPGPARRSVSGLLGLLVAFVLAAGWLAAPPTPASAAAAPKGLAAVSRSHSAVALIWSPSPGAPKYRVQYATKASMAGATYRRFTGTRGELTGLRPDTTYYVKVRVISADGANLSSYSAAIAVRTRSRSSFGYLSPAGLTATDKGPDGVALNWQSRGGGIRYRVQYATKASMSGARYVRFGSTSGSIGGLTAATAYWFKVRVIDGAGRNLSEYSPAIKVATTARPKQVSSRPLRVGSFNVKCANCYSALPEELPWSGRRSAVIASIKSQKLDVLGLQEASQAWLKDSAGRPVDVSQFEDLVAGLGSPWKLTNAKRNNCVKDKTPTGCVYADQGASKGTKIVYNSASVELISAGSQRLHWEDRANNERYVVWAVLRQRSTGTRFFFANTHLEAQADELGATKNYEVRRRQAAEVAATIKARNTGKLPVIVVGDLNSHKWTKPSNGPYDVLRNAGYVDPLGNTYNSTTTAPGATVERRIRTSLNSFNGFARVAPVRPTWINGTYLDYIFTTPMRVSEWETVAQLDASGRFVGVIPSDHNLIRATVWLPAP